MRPRRQPRRAIGACSALRKTAISSPKATFLGTNEMLKPLVQRRCRRPMVREIFGVKAQAGASISLFLSSETNNRNNKIVDSITSTVQRDSFPFRRRILATTLELCLVKRRLWSSRSVRPDVPTLSTSWSTSSSFIRKVLLSLVVYHCRLGLVLNRRMSCRQVASFVLI